MRMRTAVVLLALSAPLSAATLEGALRPGLPMIPRRAPVLRMPAPAPRPESEEHRRLVEAWSGTVVKRAQESAAEAVAGTPARALSAAIKRLHDGFWNEEVNLRQDRAAASEALLRAPRGSAERRALLQAIEVDTILLDDYPRAYAAIAAARTR